ncbi:MAG: porin family protein [Bacteroidia bacterium]|nr:porin family protein [Bacteroidia bacterium]
MSLQAVAQSYGNNHPFDLKKFNLGLLMGVTYNTYNVKEQINIVDNGVLLQNIQLVPRYGLNFGIITNMNLHKQVSMRFIPQVSLEERDFTYYFADSTVNRKIEASYLNFPVTFQFKTGYYRAMRTYVVAGAQYGVNLASNKRVRNDKNLLKISNQDLSLVFGFGFNIYGDRIKLSPEIRYSLGLLNLYEPQFTSHANAIELLSSQVLSINVNFE